MRSSREIAFRLNQEFTNLRLLAFPPVSDAVPELPFKQFPSPQAIASRLAGKSFAKDVLAIAEDIHNHRFPLIGFVVETGPDIQWRRDYINAKETSTDYLRLIPYLDQERAGDHKNIWELSRHQHLVLLAQAFLLSGERRHVDEIVVQLESWWLQNPFQRGINWTSALEVAFRALSWLWILHFVGKDLPEGAHQKLLTSLYQHGWHLETNLSYYFSPNTHLLGEAIVLHAIAVLIPQYKRSKQWQELGARVVNAEMERQVHGDGAHFEKSTYYHVYATDMFLFHSLLAEVTPEYRGKLEQMAVLLDALLGYTRSLPFMGDDDGGRWFHPYGNHAEYGRATIATCSHYFGRKDWRYEQADLYPQAAWWIGVTEGETPIGNVQSQLFRDVGLAVMRAYDRLIIADGGGFGPGRAGHTHADSLSLVLTRGDEEVLIDPATYTYVGDAKLRDWFRGTAAHNTIRIDLLDQADPKGPFWWEQHPVVHINEWTSTKEIDVFEAECRYRGFTHRRRLRFVKPDLVLLVDDVSGPEGEHLLEQFWHFGTNEANERLILEYPAEPVEAWRSRVLGQKEAAVATVVRRRVELPASMAAAILLSDNGDVTIERRQGEASFVWKIDRKRDSFSFPAP